MAVQTPSDLLIVGAGHLGHLIGTYWRQRYPSAQIYGETRTETSHSRLRSAGIIPVTSASTPSYRFPHVVFCAPPRAFEDYPASVGAALARVQEGGRMVFTSSGSVHGGQVVEITERTPVVNEGRGAVLAEAERVVLQRSEGCVARLSGLYLVDRGPHSYWLEKGSVTGAAEGMLNLVYYGDAAMAVVKVLQNGEQVKGREKESGRVYLVSAAKSVSRQQVCQAALRHPLYQGKPAPRYGEEKNRVDRIYDNQWTREVLGWRPQYESFVEFMEKDARRIKDAEMVRSG